MADLYYAVLESNDLPESPDEENYIGTLTLYEHRSLATLFEVCAAEGFAFPYFEDGYLAPEQVLGTLRAFESFDVQGQPDSLRCAHGKFVLMLRAAAQRKTGILSFCD